MSYFCLHHGKSTNRKITPLSDHTSKFSTCISNMSVNVKKRKGVCTSCKATIRNNSLVDSYPISEIVQHLVRFIVFMMILIIFKI